MKKNVIYSCIVAAMLSTSVIAAPVVKVNGQAIDKSQVDAEVAAIKARTNGQTQDSPALRENIQNQLITQVLIEQEAKKRGLDKTKDYQTALNNLQSRLLSEAFVADVAKKNTVSDSDARKIYDQMESNLKGTQEVKLRQIVTNKEADANKAIAELNKGKDFAAVAKTYSLDVSKDNGGLIDSYENLKAFEMGAPEIFAAINPLSKGQYNKTPIQANGNFVILKVEDKRNAVVPKFDDVKAQIKDDLLRQKIGQTVEELRQKATISK
ncbi:peptidylprolyl isomerase [Neisseria sp. Ec49-e6-T10]|uniref:peptidylprolyl isomerase n=1 Tax=Neisseria sp. Ec49-e6-T10 TaxID=3140744 RepID=UPI003EB84245